MDDQALFAGFWETETKTTRKVIARIPEGSVDIVHHRGQITTYLRPMGSTVPQIYGPVETSRDAG